jgi:hypothetical protein
MLLSSRSTNFCAADWIRLAAAPAFAIMALLTGILGNGQMPMICSAAHDAPLLAGMAPMYALMSVFHATPWLKLIADRRNTFSNNAAPYGADKRKG